MTLCLRPKVWVYLKAEINAHLLADSIYALITDQISNWKINSQHMNFDISDKDVRSQWINEVLEIYFNGVVPQENKSH